MLFLKENRKTEFSYSINSFVFKLIEQGELSNFVWNVIPDSRTCMVKAFVGLF